MSKNIREVYEDRDNLMRTFNESLTISIPGRETFSFFKGYELGSPVVMADDLATKWLELNYLYSTGFRPNMLPGVGEIGADIQTNLNDNQKYMTVPLVLMDKVIMALTDFREVEEICSEWVAHQNKYSVLIEELSNQVNSLSGKHSQLEEFKEIFGNTIGYIGWQHIGLPSENFVTGLKRLSESLIGLEEETAQEAFQLNQELKKYSAVIPLLLKIRKYHKKVPFISDDEMVRIYSPAASGGLCLHTHPGYEDPYNSLPSQNDLTLIAAQCGAIPVRHLGGGETQGEHYIMHIPRKIFFDEVKKIVDQESINDETSIIQVKQTVLDNRLDDIMAGEILGFKIDGNKRKNRKTVVLNPVVASQEYARHQSYFKSMGLVGEPLGVDDILLDIGEGCIDYDNKIKQILAKNIGRFSKPS